MKLSKEIATALNKIPNPEMKWNEFATRLCGTDSESEISQIKRKSDFADRCMELLNYWSVQKGEGWDQFLPVLSEVSLNAPAKKLQKAIMSLQQGSLHGQTSSEHSNEQIEQGTVVNKEILS